MLSVTPLDLAVIVTALPSVLSCRAWWVWGWAWSPHPW